MIFTCDLSNMPMKYYADQQGINIYYLVWTFLPYGQAAVGQKING